MVEHKIQQQANDWVMCSCGKLFSDSKTISKMTKIQKHIETEGTK